MEIPTIPMETVKTTERKQSSEARTLPDRIAIAIATAGGAGFAPKAPGTMGSVVGVGLFGLIAYSGWYSLYWPLLTAILFAGVWSAGHVERIYGHDASKIVIDEVIGQMITIGFVSRSGTSAMAIEVILGFLLFRFFDILKPFPLRRLERLPRGIGVVADDIGAGIYGLITLVFLEFVMARIS